jgi:hypothetical protein
MTVCSNAVENLDISALTTGTAWLHRAASGGLMGCGPRSRPNLAKAGWGKLEPFGFRHRRTAQWIVGARRQAIDLDDPL